MVFSDLIAVYLFLGGASAGSYVILATADTVRSLSDAFRSRGCLVPRTGRLVHLEPARRRLGRIVYGASFLMLACGLLCLVFDLGRPGLFYSVMLRPTMSFMSIGSFALAAFGVCLAVSLAGALFDLPSPAPRVIAVFKLAGIPLALAVMLYTGLLLRSAVAIAAWQSAWLPVLFAVSALSCGCAVVVLAACACGEKRVTWAWIRFVVRFDLAVIVVELAVLALLLWDLSDAAGTEALQRLLAGDLATRFWLGFVTCGIVVPLVVDGAIVARGRYLEMKWACAVATSVLVGGLFLRLVVVASGVQAAL